MIWESTQIHPQLHLEDYLHHWLNQQIGLIAWTEFPDNLEVNLCQSWVMTAHPAFPLQIQHHHRPYSCRTLSGQCCSPKTQSFKNLPMSRKGVGSSQQKEDMIRIRQPSSSQIVQKLVTRFVALYTPLSQLLLDLKSSLHGTAHINRIIDSYGASTVIKYLSALIAFYQTCLDL